MKKLFVIGFVLLTLGSAHAGVLFQDYLNYVRLGVGTGPGTGKVTVEPSQPVGQSFAVPSNTGEIYRIGVRPAYETWEAGERVTMTLYGSPDKAQKLGEYAIDYESCHVQGTDSEDGKHDSGDKILYFQLRQPVGAASKLYFELSSTGSVAFDSFGTDTLSDGELSPSTIGKKDLSFECHVKPVANNAENLKSFFTQRLDLSRPEFSGVKSAVDASNWEKAIAETVKAFDNRKDIWDKFKRFQERTLPPQLVAADKAVADLILNDSLKNRATGQPSKWRKESYWAPEYPGTESPLALFPNIYRFDMDSLLLRAYAGTKNAAYARKAIDLRTQFILDNPEPRLCNLPRYFKVWNDRSAAARAPGEGIAIYAQLMSFPSWTNDEKLVLLAFMEDNARYDSKSTSWGNWGSEAAEATFKFGGMFPEWKMSQDYVQAGVGQLIRISMANVRADGTETEAAIGYHGIVARSLRKLIDDNKSGTAKLKESDAQMVSRTIDKMYEHAMYMTQPNGALVMYGDSGAEDASSELYALGTTLNRPDFTWVATKGKQGAKPTEASKAFPMGGYFTMRSDFGGEKLDYTDSRQMVIHNGEWFGTHGHFDLTSINLYGFGRTLVIDPGHCGYLQSPAGEDYWQSRVHSQLVVNDHDMKRRKNSSLWASNTGVDWFDGTHNAYNGGGTNYVRRRVAFVKPDYFLVDDYVSTTWKGPWTQVWNITDKDAKVDPNTKTIDTTFAEGGNLMILSQNPEKLSVREVPGVAASSTDRSAPTKIIRLDQTTTNPHFETLLYPYKVDKPGAKPIVNWERILPDDYKGASTPNSVRVISGANIDWAAFGKAGTPASYRGGKHRADADFALVRMDQAGNPKSFSWVRGSQLMFGGNMLAKAGAKVHSLAVKYENSTVKVEAPEPEASLAVSANGSSALELNGQKVSNPVLKDGMYYPFGDQKQAMVADDETGFERNIVEDKGREWIRVPDPGSWSGGLTHHETDIGRAESGDYVLNVPEAGEYEVEVFAGKVTLVPSDKIEYRIPAAGKSADKGGAVVDQRAEEGAFIITVNHQSKVGWVNLGTFKLEKGQLKINAKNVTQTDGVYFVADAMRLMPK